MQKTKLGVSVALLGAAVYFTALISSLIPLLLVAGYILLCEENEWLRRCAVKATVIFMLIALVPAVIGLVEDVFGFINTILGWTGTSFWLRFPGSFDSLFTYAARLAGDCVLLLSGVRALTMGSVSTKRVDSLINKHM